MRWNLVKQLLTKKFNVVLVRGFIVNDYFGVSDCSIRLYLKWRGLAQFKILGPPPPDPLCFAYEIRISPALKLYEVQPFYMCMVEKEHAQWSTH